MGKTRPKSIILLRKGHFKQILILPLCEIRVDSWHPVKRMKIFRNPVKYPLA